MKTEPLENLTLSGLFSVEDLRVVITGGGSGMGAGMARALAVNGATVFILGRRQEVLDETAQSAANVSGRIIPVQCDVTSKDSLQSAARTVAATTSHVDALITSSGASGPALPFPTGPSGPNLDALCDAMWETSMEDFAATYLTNVAGPLYTALAFLRLLAAANDPSVHTPARPRPQIIAVSSIASYAKGAASGYAYNSSKAALNQLFKQLGNLLVPYDVRVNVLCAGIWHTPMTDGTSLTDAAAPGAEPSAEGAYPREVVPATRIGSDKDIGGLAVWLCSGAASYLNGSVVLADGGALSIRPSSY